MSGKKKVIYFEIAFREVQNIISKVNEYPGNELQKSIERKCICIDCMVE